MVGTFAVKVWLWFGAVCGCGVGYGVGYESHGVRKLVDRSQLGDIDLDKAVPRDLGMRIREAFGRSGWSAFKGLA